MSPEWTPFPTSPRSAVFLPSAGSCIQESFRLPPDIFPSPLTQGQPQLHVFLPCSGSCIQESVRSLRMSPLPTYTRSASTACIHAFPRFMYPGIHPLTPDVSPSTLTQGEPQLHVFMPSPGSCIQESIRSLRMSPLPHLHKVSLNFTYSCLPQVHVSRNPSARSRMSPLPHLHKVSLNHNLPQVYESRNPSARSGCLPFPTYLRSAVPSPDQCLQESTSVTSGGLPSPLPQSQRCLPRISVSRSPLMSPQVDSLPHFPRVSGCHLQ
nr:uncharacterized protein LOC128705806 isoform X1 [Cherax quadricarinatus]